MHSVLFAADAGRARTIANVLRDGGYVTDVRIVTGQLEGTAADLAAAEGCPILFVDRALGLPLACTLCRQLQPSSLLVPPLLAIIGKPEPSEIDSLIAAGVTMVLPDQPDLLSLRVRFLHGAVGNRAAFAGVLAKLRASEDRYRTVLAVLEEGLLVHRRDGGIEAVNTSAGRILGLSEEEVRTARLDQDAFALLHPDGTPMSRDELPTMQVVRTGAPVHTHQMGVRRRDGSVVWISGNTHPIRDPATGAVVATVSTFIDKTDHWRAEQEFQLLLDRTPDAVLIHRDGKILWGNKRAATIVGYAPHEILGRSIADFLPARFIPIIQQRVRDRAAGIDGPPLQQALLRRDGTEIEVELFGMPTMFRGAPAQIVYGRDLTEQRRLEMQLLTAERLASLGRLATSVGHEINNPLTYVLGNLELALRALRKSGTSDGIHAMLENALQGADRVRRIVEDLRVFSQTQSDARLPVDLAAILEACVRMISGEIRSRARLVVAIEDVPPVLANDARLAQAITNVLLHATQAIPDGHPEVHSITITARRAADGRVELTVADTGAAIPHDQLPHVFDPFFTPRLMSGNTGLGLAVCKTLVASQGGEIFVESEPDQGTRVTILLEATSRPDAAPPTSPVPPLPGRRRILLVDDEPRIAELLSESLEPHDVTIATSGAEALAIVAADPAFDAIVCDLMMPGIDGIEVHAQLATRHPGLEQRIVFITGGAYTPRATSFLARATNSYLVKPCSTARLLAAIEQVTSRRTRRP